MRVGTTKWQKDCVGVRHVFIILIVIIASEMQKYVRSSQTHTLVISCSLGGNYILIKRSEIRTLMFQRYTLNVLQKKYLRTKVCLKIIQE